MRKLSKNEHNVPTWVVVVPVLRHFVVSILICRNVCGFGILFKVVKEIHIENNDLIFGRDSNT